MDTLSMLFMYKDRAWFGKDMSAWAMRLLEAGIDTPEVCMLAAQPDVADDRAARLFATICQQIGLSEDIDAEVEQVVERESLRAYAGGEMSGAALMWTNAPLQKRLGLPLVIHTYDVKLMTSEYYTLEGHRGEALEQLVRDALVRAGLV